LPRPSSKAIASGCSCADALAAASPPDHVNANRQSTSSSKPPPPPSGGADQVATLRRCAEARPARYGRGSQAARRVVRAGATAPRPTTDAPPLREPTLRRSAKPPTRAQRRQAYEKVRTPVQACQAAPAEVHRLSCPRSMRSWRRPTRSRRARRAL
jgi:hypothetical protein